MARRKIGEAYTNENGVATFEYTGEGKGKVQIVAVSGKVESEIKDFYDCILYDQGTSDVPNSNCWVNTGANAVNMNRENNTYTSMTVADGKTSGLTYIKHDLVDGETIEMDLYIDADPDAVIATFRAGSTGNSFFNITPASANIAPNTWSHVVFSINIHDGATIINMTSDNGSASFTGNIIVTRMYFRLAENINEIRFKNLKLY